MIGKKISYYKFPRGKKKATTPEEICCISFNLM